MDEDTSKQFAKRASGSLTLGVNANVSLARAYSERLTMPEAIQSVARMLDVYPNARTIVSEGYFGAIAAILCKYPKQAALHCADPTAGVATTSDFIPTAEKVIKWLEREQLRYRNAADRERRTAEQFAQRRREEEENKAEPLEHRRKVAERLTHELREAFAGGKGEIPNVFVSTFAPQYREMCQRAEHEPPEKAQYGHSLEDKTRMGIWMPLEWLKPTRAKAKEPWKRFSVDDLRKIYEPKP